MGTGIAMPVDLLVGLDDETMLLDEAGLAAVQPRGAGKLAKSAKVAGAGLDGMTPAERDHLLMEHLPTVRYLARRIHERLPQHVDLEKREAGAHVARMLSPGEKTLCVSFEVRMPNSRGALTMCLPAVVLNTILRKLIAERDRPRRRSNEIRQRVRELMGEATVGATLQFPPVRLRAREIAGLPEGMVLRLPVPRHALAELRVGRLALGRARPVRMGEHRGARMEAPERESIHRELTSGSAAVHDEVRNVQP